MFIVVSLIGLSLASMRIGGLLATGTICILSILTLAFAIVAFVGCGWQRAFATGFLIPTIAYLGLVYMSTADEFDPNEGGLTTTRIALPLFQTLRTVVWTETGTGKILPDQTRHDAMMRPGSPGLTYVETPDRATFMTLTHLLFACCFGYVGGKFATYVRASQITPNEDADEQSDARETSAQSDLNSNSTPRSP